MRSVRRTTAMLLGCLASLAGCDTPPAEVAPPEPSAEFRSEFLGQGDTISRLTGTDEGLEVRKWVVRDDPARIRSALLHHAQPLPLDGDTLESFQRNGFRLVRVPADRLESLRQALGGTSVDVNAWHGQVYQWRPLQERKIAPGGSVMAIDGRLRRYLAGAMALMIRGWTMPLENGPIFTLEMLVRYDRPTTNDLRRLLGERSRRERYLPTTLLELPVQPGDAYVLTCAAVDEDWSEEAVAELAREREMAANLAAGLGQDATSADEETPGETASPRVRTGPPAWGPALAPDAEDGGGTGPVALTPPTLAEWLFSSDLAGASRGIVIFIPRVPAPAQLAGGSVRSDA